ncbi:MAG: hypothetical protein WC683_12670 [bacterium]
MTPRPDFTMQDLEALAAAMTDHDNAGGEGVSVAELCAALGWGVSRVRDRLRDLQRAGRLRLCQRVSPTLNGRLVRQVTYALTADGEGNVG